MIYIWALIDAFSILGGIFSLYNGTLDQPILNSNISEVRMWKSSAASN